MPEDIIIGFTNKPHYVPIGKLADGTPIFKYSPPPPKPKPYTESFKEGFKPHRENPDEKDESVKLYNQSVNVDDGDMSEFLETFADQEEKDRVRAEYQPDHHEIETPITEDKTGVLDYFNELEPDRKKAEEMSDTSAYLMLFQLNEEQEKEKRARIKQLQERRQLAIEEDDRIKAENGQLFANFLVTLSKTEWEYNKKITEHIQQVEKDLLEAYKHILKEEDYEELYTDHAEYKIIVHPDVRAVVITNKDNGVAATFNYYGLLQDKPTISGYKLRMYSMSRDEEATQRFLRAHSNIDKCCIGIITHRHTTYDLRTGQIIENETFVISKFDPEMVSAEECDVVYESTNNAPWHGSLVWYSGQKSAGLGTGGYHPHDNLSGHGAGPHYPIQGDGWRTLDPEGVDRKGLRDGNGVQYFGREMTTSYGGDLELSPVSDLVYNRAVTGRGGYIVSETGRASGTFLNVDSGCLVEDIWLKREMPTEEPGGGALNALGGGFKGTFGISYRTVTGPQAYNTALYAPLTGFSQYSGHSILTATDSVCAEPGTDFQEVTGHLWFRHFDRTPLQLTGIQILEDYESNVNAAQGVTQVRAGEFVPPGPLGVKQTNTGERHPQGRQNTTSKIFWVQLRDLSAGDPDVLHGSGKNNNPGASFGEETFESFGSKHDQRTRAMNIPVNKYNIRHFGLSADMSNHERTERRMVDAIPIRIQSRHHGYFTINHCTASSTGTMADIVGYDTQYDGSGFRPMQNVKFLKDGPPNGAFKGHGRVRRRFRTTARVLSGAHTLYSGYGVASSSTRWAIMPDGHFGGIATMEVERLSGVYGDVTVRVCMSGARPPFRTGEPGYTEYAGIVSATFCPQHPLHVGWRDGDRWGREPGQGQYVTFPGPQGTPPTIPGWPSDLPLPEPVGWRAGGPGLYLDDYRPDELGLAEPTVHPRNQPIASGARKHPYQKRLGHAVREIAYRRTSRFVRDNIHNTPISDVDGYNLSGAFAQTGDPLSADIGTLTWAHGESGKKHIQFAAGDTWAAWAGCQGYQFGMHAGDGSDASGDEGGVTWANDVSNPKEMLCLSGIRWCSIFLSFTEGPCNLLDTHSLSGGYQANTLSVQRSNETGELPNADGDSAFTWGQGDIIYPTVTAGPYPGWFSNSVDFQNSDEAGPVGVWSTYKGTVCSVIACQKHGRDKATGGYPGSPAGVTTPQSAAKHQVGHNVYNDDEYFFPKQTEFIGSSARPFFLGISGWDLNWKNDTEAYPGADGQEPG